MRPPLLLLVCFLPTFALAQQITPPSSLAGASVTIDVGASSNYEVTTSLLEPDGTFYDVSVHGQGAGQLITGPLRNGTYTYQTNSGNTATLTFNYSDGTTIARQMVFQALSFPEQNLTASGSLPGNVIGNFTVEALSAAWKLTNISSRSLVSPTVPSTTGFVVSGNIPRYVLVRAVGPSLIPLGVADAVSNASIQVYQGSTLIAQNSGWSVPSSNIASLTATFAQVGAFSLSPGSADAALVVLLSPGSYTAEAWSTQTGEVLVEAYLVP